MEPGLRQQRRHPQPASPGAPGGDNLDSLQARAQGLHDVADRSSSRPSRGIRRDFCRRTCRMWGSK